MALSRAKCAYCGNAGKLTAEHVAPAFLLRAKPDARCGWNGATQSYLNHFEARVKDVCAQCNNQALAILDNYGKEFVEKNDCLSSLASNTTGSVAELRFQYDLLLRWVLKVLYNSARFGDSDPECMRKFIPYILRGRPIPKTRFLKISIEVFTDMDISQNEYYNSKLSEQGLSELPPLDFRAGLVRLIDPDLARMVQIRYFAIGAFVFYVFSFKYSCKHANVEAVMKTWKKEVPYDHELSRNKDFEKIRVSKANYLDRFSTHSNATLGKWQEFAQDV